MKKTVLVLVVLAAVLAPAALADAPPVTVVKAPKLGKVVATKAHNGVDGWFVSCLPFSRRRLAAAV